MNLFIERAPWFVAGPAIGLLVVLALWIANRPFGALGGYISLARAEGPQDSGWRRSLLAGVVIGGFLSAIASGTLSWSADYGELSNRLGQSPVATGGVLLLGGLLMGYGADTAGGCTSGHGICGNSYGSPASLLSTATFMAVAMALTNLFFRVLS